MMRWERHITHIGKKRNAYIALEEKPERKRRLGRPKCKWIILRWISEKLDMMIWPRLI